VSPSGPIQKIEGLNFDLAQARAALAEFVSRYPMSSDRRQLSLTVRSESNPSVDDGVGSLYDFKASRWLGREKDFCHFHPEFKGTYFHEIYLRLQKNTQGKIGRVRVMLLPPKACYSIHQDPTVRYHLVLTTNPQAFLIFPERGLIHIPADGNIYWVDTRLAHTAMNGGDDDRFHLVMSEVEPD
jgi:hypothetical protein